MTNIIGNNIKTLRENMGLTQLNVVNFLNVDQSLISKFEKAKEICQQIC